MYSPRGVASVGRITKFIILRGGCLKISVCELRRLLPLLPLAAFVPVSLRLGHARVLTVHRTVIHYTRAATLPPGGRSMEAVASKYRMECRVNGISPAWVLLPQALLPWVLQPWVLRLLGLQPWVLPWLQPLGQLPLRSRLRLPRLLPWLFRP